MNRRCEIVSCLNFLQGVPKNLYQAPNEYHYFVGESIICYADANPPANITWQNMQSGEIFYSDTIDITDSLLGNTWTLRCQARNIIQGKVYAANLPTNITVIGG